MFRIANEISKISNCMTGLYYFEFKRLLCIIKLVLNKKPIQISNGEKKMIIIFKKKHACVFVGSTEVSMLFPNGQSKKDASEES